MMWQPMETAPKDGSYFVGWAVTTMDEYDDDYYGGSVPVRKGVKDYAPVIMQWFSLKGLEGGQFVEIPFTRIVSNREYTHWMALPAPPPKR